jgi:Holliday junction resolvase RusA-like endonuclease
MTLLHCIILGEPVAKGRPRLGILHGHARAFTPEKTRTWEADAAAALNDVWGHRAPLQETPVRVIVLAVKSRPGSLMAKKHDDGRLWRTKKPDADNVAKCACDALVAAGVLRDDTLVVRLEVESLYASRTEGPRVEIWVDRVSDLPVAQQRAVAVA